MAEKHPKVMPELPGSATRGGKMGGSGKSTSGSAGEALLRWSRILFACALAASGGEVVAQVPMAECSPAIARIVSLQGEVGIQRAGIAGWLAVDKLDTAICAGDRLRTAERSRAAVFISPETIVRVDQNTTISLHQTTDEVLVEFHTEEVAKAARDARACGAGYVITRFPKKFRVTTAHLNAAVEGTEFMVESSCEATQLTVLEGKVRSESAATGETRILTANERLATGPGVATAFTTVIKPEDAVQWVLRYPPLSDARAGAEIPDAENCRLRPVETRSECFADRAESLLRLGSIDEALDSIELAVAVDRANSNASALHAIIRIAKNDRQAALQVARQVTVSDPRNYRGWLALSYAQQASFALEQSLESARRAQVLEPNNSLISSRVAELLLSLGFVQEAEDSARAAIYANPNESQAHTMLGFVQLSQINTTAAERAFRAAIEHDSFNALPRLGLGLALIREGKLVEGREQLEIAVALDPTNASFRSYIGKAYYEENSVERDRLAASQFSAARELDPNDPTHSYYDAILNQSQNRPVDALESFELSIDKNDNRAIYRSRLLLDDDAAARNASVAAIYGNLGFEKLAIVESVKAIDGNATNHSAHRMLATAYANLPRHEIARVSEALQAQIRQPVSALPIDPLLVTDSLLVVRSAGPSQFGANEYGPLFNRNQLKFWLDGFAGSRDTLGNQAVVSGLADRFSFALSELSYETNGFMESDAAERTIYDAFVQGQLTDTLSLQIDIKRSELEIDETFFSFDPILIEPDSISEESDSARISAHYVVNPGNDWVVSAAYEDRLRTVSTLPDDFVFTRTEAIARVAEVQNVRRFDRLQLVVGAGFIDDDQDFVFEQAQIVSEAANLYVYGQWRPTRYDLTIHTGAAAEFLDVTNTLFANPVDRRRLSPKIGIVWSPIEGTTLRAAAFSTVRRPFIRSQTVEPTQVAGFNQFFTGFHQFFGDQVGTISDRLGIAIDQSLSSSVKAGVEIARRNLDVPSFIANRDFSWEESSAQFYIYRTFRLRSLPEWQASASFESEYEEIKRPQLLTGQEGIRRLRTIRMPVGFRFFGGNGITLRATATYVKQEGAFSADVAFGTFRKSDDALIVDGAVEYRLPRRRGTIEVGANNLADEFIDLLETDPLNPRVTTRRLVFVKFRLNF